MFELEAKVIENKTSFQHISEIAPICVTIFFNDF